MKENFVIVKIKCSPLMKSFLESNFGNPVNMPEDHFLNKLAAAQLGKKNSRCNFDHMSNYTAGIDLVMTKNNLRYDGFLISQTNAQRFNAAVESFIRNTYCINLDSLLLSREKQKKWKEKYFELIDLMKNDLDYFYTKEIRKLKCELAEHEIDIKQAIEIVVMDVLKIDFTALPYETIKKNYYRYRKSKEKQVAIPAANVT